MKQIIVLFMCMAIMYSCATEGSSKIETTDSGYKYQVIKKGSGEKAVKDSYAYFHAEVKSVEGELVFSSQETGQPGIMKLEETTVEKPSPFSDILLKGNVGDSIHVFLGKGQGVEGSGFDSLIYKIGFYEMANEEQYRAKIKEEQAKNAALVEKSKAELPMITEKVANIYSDIKAGKLDADTKTTDSGLKYIIHEKGTGALPEVGQRVGVNYYGILSRNGEMFDNSWKRGQAFAFPLGQGRVIKGWDEGVALLNKGTKATLIIPSDLGYGDSGSGAIKAGDELIFYIEVQE